MESINSMHIVEESVLGSQGMAWLLARRSSSMAPNALEELVEMIQAQLPFKLSFHSVMHPSPL